MRAELAVAHRAFRQLWLTATVWAVVFGATVAASAVTYVSSFPDLASRQQIAASTGQDAGVSMLLGPISAIDTVGGYTVYKCYVFLTTIGAIWGLLAATRLLRGEEDTGRWQLVLAGGTRASRATLATLAALAGAVAIVFAGTVGGTLLAARNPDVGFATGDALVYGLSIATAPAVFIALGALTSQLGRSRRVATGLGMTVFGIAFVVRMLADSGTATHWMLWLTPFGWIERMRPFSENDPRPLLVAAAVVAVLAGLAVVLAARRDTGSGVLASRDTAPPRWWGLQSPLGLAARLDWPVLVAWCGGALGAAYAFGIIAKIATGSIPTSFNDVLGKFGLQGSFLRQFLGVSFLFFATLVALVPVSQVGALADEETSGRLVHLLVRPVRRWTLLAGRLALATTAVVVAAVLSGFGAWAGAKTQGVDPGLGSMLGAGLNLIPTALVVLGAGAVVLAVAPRAAAPAVYGIVTWSFLGDLLASLVDGLGWLERLSLFHYLALAPAQGIDAATACVCVAVAAALAGLALTLFSRRDVATG